MDSTATALLEKHYGRDVRARAIADSAVAQAMRDHGRIDPERAEQAAHDIARTAAALVVAHIYEDDMEICTLRMERDRYRKLAEDMMKFTPSLPFFLETVPNSASPSASS